MRNFLKFMFTPSLPSQAGCQIDHSRNNAIFPFNSRFHALKYVESRHHAFLLGPPQYLPKVCYVDGGLHQKVNKMILRPRR